MKLSAKFVIIPFIIFSTSNNLAYAGTPATGNLQVTATVNSSCQTIAGTMFFGNVHPNSVSPTNVNGSITALCTTGTTYAISLSTASLSSSCLRTMTSGTNTMQYALYTDSARSKPWGDAMTGNCATTYTATGTGSGGNQTIPVYGQIPGGQTGVADGAYTDNVTITLTPTN